MINIIFPIQFLYFQISGCTDVTLSLKALNLEDITDLWATRFVVDSQVTETSTGVTFKRKARKYNFLANSVKMSFAGTLTRFKPGLPFSYVVRQIKYL